MIQSVRAFIQAGFMSVLVAGSAFAAAPAATHEKSAAPASTAVDTSGPSQLIESSANVILAGIDARRAEFRKDPTDLYKLVESTLLPNFDTPYAAQLVLGQHWRNASADQRKRFVEAFYKSLLYTYGDAMVEVPVEIWTYNFGPYKLMRRVRFVDGLVEEIETLGYGYRANE